jgi:amino acid adenylation domain-containing protein
VDRLNTQVDPTTKWLTTQLVPNSVSTTDAARAAARDDGTWSPISWDATHRGADLAEVHPWRLETLPRLFEARASQDPQGIALTSDGRQMTYRELDEQANRLARRLKRLGVGPDMPVGLCLERDARLVVALLGILKAGGAYLPLDPSYPQERLSFMLADAGSPVLVTTARFKGRFASYGGAFLCVDEIDGQGSWDEPAEETPGIEVRPDDLAYIIYTSGSTGVPKGVMVTHRNVVRLFTATEPWFRFSSRDVWTLFHSYAFDFSVWELWGALLYGGRLVMVPHLTSRSPEDFYRLLVSEGVTVLNQTPSAFRQLARAEERLGMDPRLALRLVVFGGEALEMQTLRGWFERHGDQQPRLINMYGITETTVHVTYRPLTVHDVDSGSVIGREIPDLKVHLLDASLRPVAPGIAGEICVGGAGLARGYLNRPELTAERFVSDPFSSLPGARLYRSGDLGRWKPDGDLEYLGRIDQQVKIRGFRIELGEIEAALNRHPNVRECVVVAMESPDGGEKRLVGYVVARDEAGFRPDEVRAFLRDELPGYMVPGQLIVLESLPLTVNGKVDRAALPQATRVRDHATGEAPRASSELEECLLKVWREILGLERAGVHDNFFDLGGTSLTILRAHEAVMREVRFEFPVTDMFQFPTVAALARRLRESASTTDSAGQLLDRTTRQLQVLKARRRGSGPSTSC